jgi:hypothetical protein
MATFTYWVAERTDDATCYSLIGKTRKAVQAMLDSGEHDHATYEPIVKKTFQYKDAFDLFDFITSEEGGRTAGW